MLFEIIFFIIVFTVAYLFFSYIFNDMLKKEKYTKITELKFLTNHFKLDKKKCNYKELLNGCAIINAFIIGFTVALVDYININVCFQTITRSHYNSGTINLFIHDIWKILKQEMGK